MKDFPNHPSFYPSSGDSADQRRTFEQLVRETIRQLHHEARYQDFFAGYTAESVNDFIAEYAVLRSWYTVNGSHIQEKSESEALRFRELAVYCLWEIQQKKLFNLHAEWRAGVIELPGVLVSQEITMWEKQISNCPYIEPVTPSELNIYLKYLYSGTYEDKNRVLRWQDYDTFRHCDETLLPAWFKFYDKETGTDYLLALPDAKGDEELRALVAFRKKYGNTAATMLRLKPELHFNYDSLNYFIRNFEPGRILECFLTAEPHPLQREKDAALQSAIKILQSAEGAVALPDAADWREALIRGAADYKAMMIARELRHVYEEYLFRISSGIVPVCPHDDEDAFAAYKAEAELIRHQFEAGRKLMS